MGTREEKKGKSKKAKGKSKTKSMEILREQITALSMTTGEKVHGKIRSMGEKKESLTATPCHSSLVRREKVILGNQVKTDKE